jgi:endonuclease/exonuclease/phosphatase family metal-dependent hydrolase
MFLLRLPIVAALVFLCLGAGTFSSAASAKQAETKVLAYNIFVDFKGDGWAGRKAYFHDYLTRETFDIMALQEVAEPQIADIAKSHPRYDYIVGERSDGHRADQNWYEFNPILFLRDRYELLRHGSFWVSENSSTPGSILPETKFHGRVFTWTILKDRQTSKNVLVGSVHIHGLRAFDELSIIFKELDKLNHNGPVLLLGDYNMTPDSAGYRYMTGTKGFVDASRAALSRTGPDRTMITGDVEYTIGHAGARQSNLDAGSTIDYIFYCGAKSVAKNYSNTPNQIKDGLHVSDHFAQSAVINLRGDCPAFKRF